MARREEILDEIRRLTAANNGQPPGRRAFELETGIRGSEWYGVHWARWGDALIEAGFSPNEKQGRIDEQFFLQKLAEAFRHYGRVPTVSELKMYRKQDPQYPTHNVLYNHFKTKDGMLWKLRDWVLSNPEFADVAVLIGSHNREPVSASKAPAREGCVYLIKSGSHYKIGRSDQIERRVKEIRIALPEAVSLVHVIRTDDPSGIEAYWHRRFSDRRANGEWFKLASSDIAAFRRRRYQ